MLSAFEIVDPIYDKPIHGGAYNICGSVFSDTMSLDKKSKILPSLFGYTILPKDCHVEKIIFQHTDLRQGTHFPIFLPVYCSLPPQSDLLI